MKTYTLFAGLLTMLPLTTLSGQTFSSPVTPMSSYFSDANGWNQPQYGTTIMFADINGDGKADVCGRGPNGIYCQLSKGKNTFGAPYPAQIQSDFSDAKFWNQSVVYYGSIRFADVNGDTFPDICGKGIAGVYCALNNGDGTFASATLWSSFFSDDSDGDEPHYGATLMFADINGDGKADVCARGGAGVYCALSTGISFGPQFLPGPEFTDAGVWFQLSNAGSLRLADVNGDGKPDICGRSSDGIVCDLNNGNGTFAQSALMDTSFGDGVNGWGHVRYGTTVMFADINHDNKADVCGRGPEGIWCELSTGKVFSGPRFLAQGDFSDANGWNQPMYYGSIRFADVDGDGKPDICGRGAAGIYCAFNLTR